MGSANTANVEMLRHRAGELAGRPVEVEKLPDGKYIVLWLQFEQSPPPKGESEKEALMKFIEYRLANKSGEDNLPMDDTVTEEQNGTNDRPATKGNQDDQGAERP